MVQNTYYTRDYERWVTPVVRGSGETYCLAFGTTAHESRQRAFFVDQTLDFVKEESESITQE